MKKLALLAAVAVVSTSPALANTGYSSKQAVQSTPPSYTIVDRDMKNDTVRYVTTTQTTHYVRPSTVPGQEIDYSGRYHLADGQDLIVKGDSAYLAAANSDSSFYAPKGAYKTDRGETLFVDDGQVQRMEAPPQMVYVDTDDIMGKDYNQKVTR